MRATRSTSTDSRPRARGWLALLAATAFSLVATSLSGGVALAAKASTAPDTTITSSPTNPSSSTSASFAFTGTKGATTFTCKLDSGAAGACTSPKAYSGLAAGFPHVLRVRHGEGSPGSIARDLYLGHRHHPPGAPTGLAATTPTATSVRLTWLAATDNIAHRRLRRLAR